MEIIRKTQTFLQLFMSKTLAVRLVSMILITAGLSNKRVTELTGLCDKSVRVLRKHIEKDELESQFAVKGGGRKRKLMNVESAVIEEIEKNDYHSHQQIVDMIQEKFSLKVSKDSVARMLKKTK